MLDLQNVASAAPAGATVRTRPTPIVQNGYPILKRQVGMVATLTGAMVAIVQLLAHQSGGRGV